MAEEVNRAWKDQYMLRLPEGMRDRIKQSAEVTGRSMNAEIVQRLKWSFEDIDEDGLRIVLRPETANALMTDAAIHGVQDEDRAAEILESFYGKSETSTSLERVRTMAAENEELSLYVNHLKDKEDADFLLYYSKVVQLRQLAQAVIAAGDHVPPELMDAARDIEKLGKAEIEMLANRHEDAIFKRKLAEHRRRLQQEIDDAEHGTADDDDAPITLGREIKDPN